MSSDIPSSVVNYSMTVDVDGWTIPEAYYFYPDLYCNTTVCPLALAQITGYVPSLGGNALYLVIFALLIVAQIFLGIKYRTWGFLAGMIGGLVLEILGYASRVELNKNPFSDNWFKIYLIGLTIGPAFLSGAIYLCLARIIVVYGRNISRIRPAWYTIAFICFDLFSLVLQAIGGAIASTSDSQSSKQSGINIMIAGLSTQVVSLFLFMALCSDFAFSVYKNQAGLDPTYAQLRRTTKFKGFLIALAAATLFIFIRSCFRVAELQEGFDGKLANQQVTFMILEGAMVILAVFVLTILHPAIAFQGEWHKANFAIRKSKDKSLDMQNLHSTEKDNMQPIPV